MKIAVVLRSIIITGGGERQAIMMARELIVLGHAVTIYTTVCEPSVSFEKDLAGLKICQLPNLGKSPWKKWAKLPLLGQIFSALEEERLARALASLIEIDTDIINPADLWGGHVGVYFKRRHRRSKVVLMLNDLYLARWSIPTDPLFNPPRRPTAKKFYYFLKDFLEIICFFNRIDRVVVLNQRTAGLVKSYTGREATVVRSGIDLARFAFRPRQPPSKNRPIKILSQGLFFPHRRFEDVIAAVCLLKSRGYDFYLKIIGDFEHKPSAQAYFNRLRRLVVDLQLDSRVVFVGRVSDEVLLDAYYQADIFVSAAHLQTWGLAVFEALATGLPAVISETIGAAEVLMDQSTVLLVPPGKPETIAGAVGRLIDEPELYERLSNDGARFVRANFSWRRYALTMAEIFKNTYDA